MIPGLPAAPPNGDADPKALGPGFADNAEVKGLELANPPNPLGAPKADPPNAPKPDLVAASVGLLVVSAGGDLKALPKFPKGDEVPPDDPMEAKGEVDDCASLLKPDDSNALLEASALGSAVLVPPRFANGDDADTFAKPLPGGICEL